MFGFFWRVQRSTAARLAGEFDLYRGRRVGLARRMTNAADEFVSLVVEILRRFCAQNALVAPVETELAACARQLWALIGERGLPAPLPPNEQGEPGELPEAECDALVTRVFAGISAAACETLAAPVRQLVKACFYPEFKICRDSFREVSPDGSCRRQQLSRVRQRISGAHCVDCPYWIALAPGQHGKFLRRHWRPEGRAELAENEAIFLPEDFRALRRFVRAVARARIQA
jgi:hypothetical protein